MSKPSSLLSTLVLLCGSRVTATKFSWQRSDLLPKLTRTSAPSPFNLDRGHSLWASPQPDLNITHWCPSSLLHLLNLTHLILASSSPLASHTHSHIDGLYPLREMAGPSGILHVPFSMVNLSQGDEQLGSFPNNPSNFIKEYRFLTQIYNFTHMTSMPFFPLLSSLGKRKGSGWLSGTVEV